MSDILLIGFLSYKLRRRPFSERPMNLRFEDLAKR
jgi:hypothetical protein